MQSCHSYLSIVWERNSQWHTTATFTPTMTGNNIGQNHEELRQPQHLNVQFRPPTKNLYIIKF